MIQALLCVSFIVFKDDGIHLGTNSPKRDEHAGGLTCLRPSRGGGVYRVASLDVSKTSDMSLTSLE